jgi:hypothetical protein
VTSGAILHFCVEPYLRILLICFARGNPALPNEWFTTSILPTFALAFLPSYFTRLEEICLWSYHDNADTAVLALRFLLKIWPQQCSRKVPLFLRHIPVIVANLTDREIPRVMERLWTSIAACLVSEHAATAMAAKSIIISHREIFERFTPWAKKVSGIVMPALLASKSAWHRGQNALTDEAIGVLRGFDPGSFEEGALSETVENREWYRKLKVQLWAEILELV